MVDTYDSTNTYDSINLYDGGSLGPVSLPSPVMPAGTVVFLARDTPAASVKSDIVVMPAGTVTQ